MAEAVNIDITGTRPPAATLAKKKLRQKNGWLASSFRESQARTDIKWIFGLPFTLWLGLFLVALSLFMVTSRENATGTITAMQQQILAQPQLTGDLPSTAPDFYALLSSPGFAEAVYENPDLLQQTIDAIPDYPAGTEVTPAQLDEETATSRGTPGAGLRQTLGLYSTPVKLLGSGVHTTAGAVLTVLLMLVLVFGIPYLLLSRRLGRLVSLGVSMAVASLPALGLLSLLDSRSASWITESRQATGEEEGKRFVAEVLQPFVTGVLGEAMSTYRLFVLAAILCLAAAAAGCTWRRVRARVNAS